MYDPLAVEEDEGDKETFTMKICSFYFIFIGPLWNERMWDSLATDSFHRHSAYCQNILKVPEG